LIDRHFSANEFEYYVQDSWRALPNLTGHLRAGGTPSLQTPWETKGQQISPTIDTHAWFSAAQRGRP